MNNFNLKPVFLFALLFGFLLQAHAQSINNYVFSTNTTSSLNRSMGSLVDDIDLTSGFEVQIGGSINNQTGALDTIPFDFWIGGTRITRFSATSNGWIGLTNAIATGTGFATATATPRLAPFLTASGNNGMGTSQNGKIQTKVFGSQPNRVFVIEYVNMAINFNGASNDSNTMQVRLYENNGTVEYVYGRMANLLGTGMNYNIGFQLAGTSVFQHVNTTTQTASTSVSTANNQGVVGDILPLVGRTPGAQRAYVWTPTPVSDPGVINISNITTSGMTLTWTNVANEIGYVVYRSTNGGASYELFAQTGINAASLNITNGLIANTTYDWRVYALRESLSAPSDAQATTLPATKFFTITGGNWNDPNIWNTLAVPSSQDSAEITTGHTVTLDLTSQQCGTLIVNGTLTYGSAATPQQVLTVNGDVIVNVGGNFNAGTSTLGTTPHVLNIGGNTTASDWQGNLLVNGTFDMHTTAGVQTVFWGTQNGTISGTGPVCDMPFITVTKGGIAPFNVNNTLEILRVITQSSSSLPPISTLFPRFAATSGTLKISAAVSVTSLYQTTQQFATVSGARFWINHASASIASVPGIATTMLLQGELRIDNGSLTLGSGGSTHNLNTTGIINLNGGLLTFNGALNIVGIATAQLNITDGRLIIDPQETFTTNTTTLNVQSAATFTMTGGTIEINDPQPTLTGGSSILIASGGVKSVTGGTIIIGSGLASPNGSTFGSGSGFGINISIPVHHLTLRNNISSSNTRMCRLMANLTVNGDLTLNSSAYLFTGNGGLGFAMEVKGNIINNGTISGQYPTITGPNGIGSLSLTGTSLQTISGSISGNTTLLSLRIANAAGANFTNSGVWALERITIEQGNVTNTTTNIQIGASTYRGNVVIGGLNESTLSGSFSSIPTLVTTFGNLNYTYGPSASSLQTGSFNEMVAGAQTLFALTINDANGVIANRDITVTGGFGSALTLTNGNLNIGTNTLTIGATGVPSSLVRTSGFVQMATNGTFRRFYVAGGAPAFDYASGFPISTGVNERSVLLSLGGGTFTGGGSISVRHTNVIGFTDITSFVDDAITVDRRSNSFWNISNASSYPTIGGNTLTLRLIGGGIGAVSDYTQLRMIRSASAAGGLSSDGTGSNTLPAVNRRFIAADINPGGHLTQDFYFGANSGVNPLSPTITAIATGNWNETATWEGGIIPAITNSASIATGVTVTIPTGYTATCNGLSINAGATLAASAGSFNSAGSVNIDGTMNASGTTVNVLSTAANGIRVNTGGTFNLSNGTVNVGTTGGGNNRFTDSGSVTISGGTLNINGNMVIGEGAVFNQSAGDINIDGNSGLAASSTAAGAHLLHIKSNALNCSGGTITIVDPPHNSISANTTNAVRMQVALGTLTGFTGSHTLRLGDGTSTETGNTNGFSINTKAAASFIPLNNVTVNGGSASGRWTSTSFTNLTFTQIRGSVLITNGSELRHTNGSVPFAIGGDITNNGTLTSQQTVILGGHNYPVVNAQAISGTGTFRNNTSSPTGEFVNLTVDNGTGLTLNTTNVTYRITGTLAIAANNITTNTNSVVVTNTGLTRTTGYIIGNLGKTLTVGSPISRTYEIGSASNYLPVTVAFQNVTTAGNVVIGINSGDHPQLGSSCINASKSVNRYWNITNNGTVSTGGNYTFSFLAGDVDGGTVLGSAKLFSYDGSAWQGGLTPSGTTATSYSVNLLTNYGAVAIGEITPVPTTVSITASSNNICIGTNVSCTATVVNGGPSPTYQWKVNGVNVGTNSNVFASTTLSNNDAITCETVSNSPCVVSPNATSNTINMTVAPLTVAGGVGGGTTICSGSTSALLTLTGHTGSIVRWESSTSSSFSTITTHANTSTTFTSGALTATTYFRAVVKSGECAEANSTSTQVTVDPPSDAKTITGNSAVCAGTPVGNLQLAAGVVGSVVKWMVSDVAPYTSFTDIANTTTTQAGGSPTVTTHYKAIVKNGTCDADTTPVFIITVTPATVGGSVSANQTICAGGTVAELNLGGGFVGSVTKWQSATNSTFTTGLVELTAVTTTNYTPPSPSVTTYYRAVVQSGGCAVVNSNHATITVNPAPVAGSIGGTNSVCSGSSPGILTLTSYTPSASLQWVTSTSTSGPWTAIGNTVDTYNPGILTATRSYRVVATISPCANDTSPVFTVTVSPTTVPGSVNSNQTICAGGTVAELNLSGNTGTVQKWQSATNSTFTTGLVELTAVTTTNYTPPSPSVTTYYRAVVQSGGCAADNSVAAIITVNPAPDAGEIGGTTSVCSGSSPGTLTLTGHSVSASLQWLSSTSPTGPWTAIGNTTDTYNPGNLTATRYYRVAATISPCANDTSAVFTVTVSPTTVPGSVNSNQTICAGGTVAELNLSGNTGTVQKWQSATNSAFTTGLVELTAVTTTNYTPPSPSVTTYYRAVVQSGGCAADNSLAAIITVNPAPDAGEIGGATSVCSGSSPGNLTLTGHTVSANLQWLSSTSPTGPWTAVGNTTDTYNPGNLTATRYYRVVATISPCTNDTTIAFMVNVIAAPVAGNVTGSHAICTGGSPTQLTLVSSSGTIQKWQSATNSGFTTGLVELTAVTTNTYTPPAPSVTTYYRAVLGSVGCTDVFSGHATITVNAASNGGTITGSTPVCSGGSTNLNLGGSVGTINKWQFADNAPLFDNWTDIANTTASYTTPSLTQTHRYRAQVTNGSCTPAFSNEFEVTVTSTGIWVGVFNGNWDNPLNWCGGVPVASTNVTIPAGTPFSPSINTTSAVANNVTVDLGATLNFSGTTNVISIAGNLVVNGTFTTTNGTVTLNGVTAQNVSAIPFNRLRILGGGTKTLTGSGNATITGDLELSSGNVEVGSANLVINGATITGGGASSFVTTSGTGNFVYNNLGSSNIVYHMGAGSSYTPVTVANTGTVDNIAVKMLGDVYTSYVGESGSGAIAANVVNRTYIFNEAVAGGSSLNVTFQWNASNELGMDRTQTIIGKYNGGVWSQQGVTTNANGSGPYTVQLNGITSLGIFGIGDVNSPLPVKLVSFTAKLADGVSKLKWTTASEINSTHFEVERGIDGYNFTQIAKVKASGNTSTRVDYKYDDTKVADIINNGDIAYYRLKFVNMNGKYEYSSVISVSSYVNMVFDVVSTVPNPFKAQTQVTFKTSSASDVTVEVTDAFGKIVSTDVVVPVVGSNKIEIGINNSWKAGIYFVKITQDENTKVVKIIRE